ncbi:MAG: hypothetical protein Ct9H90mP17_2250 [Actinomycetota bacterium]|nr:MAG: hypothetical protein Ct9H90mP17_2250 [Actinomycetota bacterium]
MNSFLNLSTNAIKTADSLIKHPKEETYDKLKIQLIFLKGKILKLVIILLLLFFFIILVFQGSYTGFQWKNFFIQAMVYFSMSFLCILAFSFIIWRLLK